MTVSAQPTIFQYVGNGVTTVFAYNCQVLQPSDLNVYVNGVAVTSGITKGGIGSLTGGTVTFTTAPANGTQVILEREVVLERTTDYQQNGDFLARVVNPDFNRIWMALQQLLTGVTRSLKFPKTDVAPITELPGAAARADKLLSFDSLGNPVVIAPAAQSATALQTLLALVTGASMIGANDNAGGSVFTTVAGFIAKILSNLGSSIVGFIQSGTGASSRTAQDKMREWVSILDFGGIADGGVNAVNVTALTNAFNDGYRFIRFPRSSSNVYYFSGALTSAVTDGVTFDVDPGVTISILDIGYLNPTLKVTRDTYVYLSALLTDYWLSPGMQVRPPTRPAPLSYSDKESGLVSPVLCNADLTFKQVTFGTDAFSAFVPTATSVSGVIIPIAATTDYRVCFKKVSPGDAISAQFTGAASATPVAMIRTPQSYYALTADVTDVAIPSSLAKAVGGASSVIAISYIGMGTHASYAAYKSIWTIRINEPRNFSILFNGMVVHTVDTDAEIIEAGFGGQGGVGGAITVQDWWMTSARKQGGAKPINVAIFGDSTSASSFNGSWPEQMALMLDAHHGLRVNFLQNYAVSGASSAGQMALCTAPNIASYDVVCILIGVNDIQGSVAEATYIANLTTMINTCLSAGKKVVVGIPTMYYGQAQAGVGKGQATLRYDQGRGYRAKCVRLCADLGVAVVNTLEYMTPALADWVNPALNTVANLGHDPILFDSIHHTQFGSQWKATAFAQVIAGLFMRTPSLRQRDTALPSANLAGSWTFTSQAGRWVRDDAGVVTLSGLIDRGAAIVDGTVIYTMPENIRPLRTVRFSAWCDAAVARIQIDATTGQISIYGFPGGGTWASLDGMTFATR